MIHNFGDIEHWIRNKTFGSSNSFFLVKLSRAERYLTGCEFTFSRFYKLFNIYELKKKKARKNIAKFECVYVCNNERT